MWFSETRCLKPLFAVPELTVPSHLYMVVTLCVKWDTVTLTRNAND